MYELHHLKGNTYYIDGPTNLGVYILNKENECVLIDTGMIQEQEIIYNVLLDNNLKLKYIVNTHCHIDHSGGDFYLIEKTGCMVITSDIERAFMLEERLDVALLYGALPLSEFKNYYINANNRFPVYNLEYLPNELTAIDLPGHHNGMIGIKTIDNVYFVADSFCSKEIVNKQKIMLIYDIKGYIDTLELVKSFIPNIIVPSHAEVIDNPSEIIDFNKKQVLDNINLILSLLNDELSIEEIISKVCYHYNLRMTHNRFLIVYPTIKSYLSQLSNDGLIKSSFINNILKFKKTNTE